MALVSHCGSHWLPITANAGLLLRSHPHYDTLRPTPAPIERYLASRYRDQKGQACGDRARSDYSLSIPTDYIRIRIKENGGAGFRSINHQMTQMHVFVGIKAEVLLYIYVSPESIKLIWTGKNAPKLFLVVSAGRAYTPLQKPPDRFRGIFSPTRCLDNR